MKATIGKREFRQSLKTSSLTEAKHAVVIRRLMANSELEDARRQIAITLPSSGTTDRPVTEADLWSLTVTWFVEKQKADARLGPADFREEDRREELAHLTDPEHTNTSPAFAI